LCVSIVSALLLPFVASAAIIAQQPQFDETEFKNGNVPINISGPTEAFPPSVSITNASGTVRTVKLRYDVLTGP